MSDRQDTQENPTESMGEGLLRRSTLLMDRTRKRFGASRKQFAIFSLLTMVAATMWARPAGLLIWNRLRIITGMPRMAIANEDPQAVAQADITLPNALEAGRSVFLEERLRRDPFTTGGDADSDGLTPGPDAPTVIEDSDLDAEKARLLDAVAAMRLNGSGAGLATAILDNRARVVGRAFESDGLRFRLLEVRSNAVLIEASVAGGGDWYAFLLERSGATPVLQD